MLLVVLVVVGSWPDRVLYARVALASIRGTACLLCVVVVVIVGETYGIRWASHDVG